MIGGSPSSFTLGHLYRYACGRLAQGLGTENNPSLEAACLLEATTGVSREMLLREGNAFPPPGSAEMLDALLDRRLAGEPLQYILGQWEFFGIPMLVGSGVLIPRPETELLVELALTEIINIPSPSLLDLCSGSGCIPIALAKNCPNAVIAGVEYSSDAMAWFKKNITLTKTTTVTPWLGDALHPPTPITSQQWQVITSNPPYIPSNQLPYLQREVSWEPTLALDGGIDGLDFYRALPPLCLGLLSPGGLLLLEIGEDQGESVPTLLTRAGYQEVSLHLDFSGHPRVVSGRSPS